MSTAQTTPFGSALRHWRRLRGVSQLDLAGAATTTRHLSYLETGRSRPSREMVERLADALVIPLRERNRLLEQAGLPSSYPEGELAADDLAAFRSVLDRLLSTHEPYPAFVVDRHWNLVDANTATQRVFPHQPGTNTVRLLIDSLSPLIENWVDVAPALVERLAADLMRNPDDEQLHELHEYAIAALPPSARARNPPPGRVMCPRVQPRRHNRAHHHRCRPIRVHRRRDPRRTPRRTHLPRRRRLRPVLPTTSRSQPRHQLIPSPCRCETLRRRTALSATAQSPCPWRASSAYARVVPRLRC